MSIIATGDRSNVIEINFFGQCYFLAPPSPTCRTPLLERFDLPTPLSSLPLRFAISLSPLGSGSERFDSRARDIAIACSSSACSTSS